MAKSKKKPKPAVKKDNRTRLSALTVDGYSTWLENLFAYDRVAIDFPEVVDAFAQVTEFLQRHTPLAVTEARGIDKNERKLVEQLMYEHRILMEIRYASYYKPAITVDIGPGGLEPGRWILMPPSILILGPNLQPESFRTENRSRTLPLGPCVTVSTDWKSQLGGNFREQLFRACEVCAARNLIHAARQAGSFEQLINQTIDKYLAYKFQYGVPYADPR